MKLIAKKPCKYGGRQFFIGDEIPVNFVADAAREEKLGVLSIVNVDAGVPDENSGPLFTQEQVEAMIAEATANAGTFTQEQVDEMLAEATAGVIIPDEGAYDGKIVVSVNGNSEGDNEQLTGIPVTQEEVQLVFDVLQSNADDGAKIVAEITSEEALALIHAVDTRKTVKEAAKKRADYLLSTKEGTNESSTGKSTTDITGGADT